MQETVKEKETCASFDVSTQTAKVTATLHGECLMRTEKTLRLWVKDINRNIAASYTVSGIGLDKETQKLLERLHLQMKKSPRLQQSRRS